jgi:ribosomal protein S18
MNLAHKFIRNGPHELVVRSLRLSFVQRLVYRIESAAGHYGSCERSRAFSAAAAGKTGSSGDGRKHSGNRVPPAGERDTDELKAGSQRGPERAENRVGRAQLHRRSGAPVHGRQLNREEAQRRAVLELFGNPAWLAPYAAEIPVQELSRMLTTFQLVQEQPRTLLADPVLPKFGRPKDSPVGVHVPESVIAAFRREYPPAVAGALELLDPGFVWDTEAGGIPRPKSELPPSVYREDLETLWQRVDERTTGADELRQTARSSRTGVSRGPLAALAQSTTPSVLPRKQHRCPLCDLAGGKARELAIKRARRERKRQIKTFIDSFTSDVLERQQALREGSPQGTQLAAATPDQVVDAALMPLLEETVQRELEAASQREVVDFRDVDLLVRFVNEAGRIQPRRRTHCCAKHQRWLARAIKHARNAALISPIRRIGFDLVGRPTEF